MSVSVGFPAGFHMDTLTHISMMRAQDACLRMGVPFTVAYCLGSSLVTVARNRVLHKFLQGDSSRLFWIDSDIEFTPTDFLNLLMSTSEADCACAVYPLKTDKESMVIKHADLQNFRLNKFGQVKIGGTGLGFCCVRRHVIERLVDIAPRVYDPELDTEIANVFRLDTIIDNEGRERTRGEDMAFFADLEAMGVDVWLDPKIKLGHGGHKTYRGDPLKALRLEEALKELQVA